MNTIAINPTPGLPFLKRTKYIAISEPMEQNSPIVVKPLGVKPSFLQSPIVGRIILVNWESTYPSPGLTGLYNGVADIYYYQDFSRKYSHRLYNTSTRTFAIRYHSFYPWHTGRVYGHRIVLDYTALNSGHEPRHDPSSFLSRWRVRCTNLKDWFNEKH